MCKKTIEKFAYRSNSDFLFEPKQHLRVLWRRQLWLQWGTWYFIVYTVCNYLFNFVEYKSGGHYSGSWAGA